MVAPKDHAAVGAHLLKHVAVFRIIVWHTANAVRTGGLAVGDYCINNIVQRDSILGLL
jgi:hypothetical protein